MHLTKSLGRDLITSYWFKKISFYTDPLAKLFQNMLNGSTTLSDWLTFAKTTLLLNNQQPCVAKSTDQFLV